MKDIIYMIYFTIRKKRKEAKVKAVDNFIWIFIPYRQREID